MLTAVLVVPVATVATCKQCSAHIAFHLAPRLCVDEQGELHINEDLDVFEITKDRITRR